MLKLFNFIITLFCISSAVHATPDVETKARAIIPELRKLIETPELIKAIKDQNAKKRLIISSRH